MPLQNSESKVSSKSSITDNHATAIFLCENCIAASGDAPEIFTADFPTLAIILQGSQPEYLGSELQDTRLPLVGVERTEFALNISAARTADFKSVVRAAGF